MSGFKAIEPQTVTAGDTLQWSKVFHHYSAADGWQLSYVLLNGAAAVQIDASHAVQSSPNSNGFDVTVAASESALWGPGSYQWQSYVTKNSERHKVGEGSMTVEPNFAALTDGALTPVDARSHNQKVYDSICAVLEGKATNDVMEYTNDALHIKKATFEELEKAKRIYAWRVAREKGVAPEYVGARFDTPFPTVPGSGFPNGWPRGFPNGWPRG